MSGPTTKGIVLRVAILVFVIVLSILPMIIKGFQTSDSFWFGIPYRLEYSQADDKFRLLCRSGRQERILNLKRLVSCRLLEPVSPAEYPEPVPENETVTLEITDERNALERAMLQFSYLAKKTERMGENTYRMTLQYRKDDETELVIRILSFGPLLKVIAPDSFAALIRERIERQVRRNET